MMIIFFPPDGNQADVTAYRLLTTEDGQKLVKIGSILIFLDSWNGHTRADILCKTGVHLWSAGHLCMHVILRRDRADTKQNEASTLRKKI